MCLAFGCWRTYDTPYVTPVCGFPARAEPKHAPSWQQSSTLTPYITMLAQETNGAGPSAAALSAEVEIVEDAPPRGPPQATHIYKKLCETKRTSKATWWSFFKRHVHQIKGGAGECFF